MILILEIDLYKSAHGAGCLVHQAARLAKIHVFRILADLGDGERALFASAEQLVYDGPHQHLEGGGRGQAGAGQHIGGRVCVKAADRIAQLLVTRADAADQGAGRVHLGGVDVLVLRVDLIPPVAFGLDAHLGVRVLGNNGDNVQIDAGRQHAAALMVRMVAADFRTPRRAEDGNMAVCAIEPFERLDGLYESLAVAGDVRRAARIDVGQLLIQAAAGDQGFDFC